MTEFLTTRYNKASGAIQALLGLLLLANDDELPQICRNRNNLRLSRLTIKPDEARVPPLPDLTKILPNVHKTEDSKRSKDAHKQTYGAVQTQSSSELSNNENSNQSITMKRKNKNRLSIEKIRSKSNDILGELFSVNKSKDTGTKNISSDSDCICVGQDSPIRKPSLSDRKKRFVKSRLSDDSEYFHTGRYSSHKKMKYHDNKERIKKGDIYHRRREHKAKESKPKLSISRETPVKKHRDSVDCKKRLEYCGEATKVKQVSDLNPLTKVKESSTSVKVHRDSVDCKKRLKFSGEATKVKQVSVLDTLAKVKESSSSIEVHKESVDCKKRLKYSGEATKVKQVSESEALITTKESNTPVKVHRDGVDIKKTEKYCGDAYTVKQISDNKTTTQVKEKLPEQSTSKTFKSYGVFDLFSVQGLSTSKHTQKQLRKFPLKQCNVFLSKLKTKSNEHSELSEKDLCVQKDLDDIKTVEKPFKEDVETQSKELNPILQTERSKEDLANNNIPIILKSKKRHFLDIFPEGDSASESNTEDDPPLTEDTSLDFTLRSSEYSDISDTDADESKDVELVSYTLPAFQRFRQVLSNVYSDISEDSDSEITVKCKSRCSPPLIGNQGHMNSLISNRGHVNSLIGNQGNVNEISIKGNFHCSSPQVCDNENEAGLDDVFRFSSPVIVTLEADHEKGIKDSTRYLSTVIGNVSTLIGNQENESELSIKCSSSNCLSQGNDYQNDNKEEHVENSKCSLSLLENLENKCEIVKSKMRCSSPQIDTQKNFGEIGLKGDSWCTESLIDNQGNESVVVNGSLTDSNSLERNNINVPYGLEEDILLNQMEEFMAGISASDCDSDEYDEEDICGQIPDGKSVQIFSGVNRNTIYCSKITENMLIKEAFKTLNSEGVNTLNIVPMEEEIILYLDGFPKFETPFINIQNENSSELIEQPVIYIDVDEESDFDSSFNFEQHEDRQTEMEMFDTNCEFQEDVQNCRKVSKLKEKDDTLMNLSFEDENDIVQNNGIEKCHSAAKEKSCFSSVVDELDSDTNIDCLNDKCCVNKVSLSPDETETTVHLQSDGKTQTFLCRQSSEFSPSKGSCDNNKLVLNTTETEQNSDKSNSITAVMPDLTSISPHSEDQPSSNSALSIHNNVSLKLIATSYASPATTPSMPVLTPMMTASSSKRKRRKVRCKSGTKTASKHINFDRQSDHITSHMFKKLSHCVKDFDLLHFQLEGYIGSSTSRYKPTLPQSEESMLDLCLDNILMIGDTFFDLLAKLHDQFEIPCYTFEFIIQALWINAGTSLRQINSARNILKKISVCDSSSIILSWQQINVSIKHMFSDVAAISSKEILQVEYFLELVMDVLKNDLYRRQLSDVVEIRQSKAYKLLSQDLLSNINRIVINYTQEALDMIENETTTTPFRSKLVKLLHWLQDLVALAIETSSCCKDRAVAMAAELKLIYIHQQSLANKKLLLYSIQSELLLFCLVELILENEFDNTQPLCDFSLDAVLSSFCQAVPQMSMFSPQKSPEKKKTFQFSTSYTRYSMEQVEELAMLQYLLTKSYIQVAKGKFEKPLHWRSGDIGLGYYDEEILRREWTSYMNDIQKHMHSLTSELSWRTSQYLMMMECLADCV